MRDLDGLLTEPVEFVCLGGFVMSLLYGLSRPTADVDVLEVRPGSVKQLLVQAAGEGSELHRKHKVHLQQVGVLLAYPEDYEERLTEMFPGALRQLRLLALDPYDLALTKLERNSQADREDVMHLAEFIPLDVSVLRKRYEEEMRPYYGDPTHEDQTLRLWIEAIEERRQKRS